MSSLDCQPNVVETDSSPNFIRSVNDVDSSDRLPSAIWESESNANFAWLLSDSRSNDPWKERTSRKNDRWNLPVKNIPPPGLPTQRESHWQYPEYMKFAERLATFSEWPKFLKGPSKKDLARAGFIYTGLGDKVTCFSCGITLRNWEPLDDAYNEHNRWSKNCVYSNMVAGVPSRGQS
ncbi:death-associated inhibitor of apoptosis 2-like [Saccostrea echinata]|uniref:death-associated inhibitor of apoptosis 2-like n=1 Tax=Saccostrea echinata TaxID=191078 RepID=UPI002A7F74C5|nr:death-associated inhibitor of apoptosis 2-like [Saccostrea echinata]